MIALIAGRLYGKPNERSSKNGNRFATAKLRVALRDGESVFVNVITFSATAITALLELDDGDSIAIAGELTPKVWTDREGVARPSLDLVGHVVMTAYHVARKRKATRRDEQRSSGNGDESRDFDDEMPPL